MTTKTIKILLRNAKIERNEAGKIVSITGRCTERGCRNTRTIHAADAFQVSRCVECQKKHLQAKRSAKRAAKAKAGKAKAETKKQRRAKADAKRLSSPAGQQIARAMADALKV